LYEFGRNLGIAFQVQDDYLDAFGDPKKFGKQVGGDIMANKKTFLMIRAMEVEGGKYSRILNQLMKDNPEDKVKQVLAIFKASALDEWAMKLKEQYLSYAYQHLEDIAVTARRKEPLRQLANALMQREN
jgi:geranylgeranyl diphosphate synthase type II